MQSDNAGIDRDALKRAAAEQAAAQVRSGMAVGLGTGSTAFFVIAALIRRAREEGLRVDCVATSERSATQARDGGLRLLELDDVAALDLTIDGADQVSPALDLIKGMGGALLREKIVAAASDRLVIVIDRGKLAETLSLPVPVEVVRFAWRTTQRRIETLGAKVTVRPAKDGGAFVTDGGNLILDCDFGRLDDPAAREHALRDVVGVIETGLFVGRAREVLVAGPGGVERLVP